MAHDTLPYRSARDLVSAMSAGGLSSRELLEALVTRIAGRFACTDCGEGYHDLYKPTKVPGVCDRCNGTEFVRRRDDNEEVVRARLKAYHAQTEPLIDYYRRQGKVSTVDGMADISAVAKEIDQALAGKGGKGVKNRAKTPG